MSQGQSEESIELPTVDPSVAPILYALPVQLLAYYVAVIRGADIDLGKLPIQTCWPNEPAPLITWPLVVTKDPDSGSHNLGIYRMQVTGRDTTLMRWLRHRGGAQHFARWRETHDGPMPAAAVIGADPGTLLAAVTPAPETLSEYQLAGLLRGKKVVLFMWASW